MVNKILIDILSEVMILAEAPLPWSWNLWLMIEQRRLIYSRSGLLVSGKPGDGWDGNDDTISTATTTTTTNRAVGVFAMLH